MAGAIRAGFNYIKPSAQTIEYGLLAAKTGCAFATFWNPLRAPATLALRCIFLLSQTQDCAQKYQSIRSSLPQMGKITTIALGIVGVVCGNSMIVMASLIADMAVECFQMCVAALKEKNVDLSLYHLAIIMMDYFAASGIGTGDWMVMSMAAAINAPFMLIHFIQHDESTQNNRTYKDYLNIMCYAALTVKNVMMGFIKDPVPPEQFPTLPVGGNVVL